MEGFESCTLSHSMDGHRSHVSIFLVKKSYYKKKDNFGHAIHFSTSRGKIEGCEICTLSPSIDGHSSHVLSSCWQGYYKKKDNFVHAIP